MASHSSASLPGQAPSKTRYWVVVFAVTLAILSYIDRVCISQAAPIMMKDLNLDAQQMGLIFSAFGIAYALFEIPGGWMGDYMGPRKVIMRIVIWWSFFTAATGWAWNFTSLYVIRFLFGAGEAGCFPNLTKAFTTWLPNHERTRAQGIMWTFARWGGAFTPPLVVATFAFMDWRWSFVLFGALGVVWAVLFYAWFRDNPKDHKGVNAGELQLLAENAELASGHGNVPWGKLVKSPTIWLLWAQYFCLSYPWYFYITWLPTFLKQNYASYSDSERAQLSILPLFFGGLGSLSAGFLMTRIAGITGSVSRARKTLACIGFAGAASLIFLATTINDNAILVMLCLGMASYCNDLVMPGAWATCMDVGGRFAGTVSGSMNMMGNMAGFVAPTVGGMLLKQYGFEAWDLFMYTMAGMYLLGTLCWPLMDPVTPLEETS